MLMTVRLTCKGEAQAGNVNLGVSSTLMLFQAVSLEEAVSVLREEEVSGAE